MSNKQKKTKQGVPDLGRSKKTVKADYCCNILGHVWGPWRDSFMGYCTARACTIPGCNEVQEEDKY